MTSSDTNCTSSSQENHKLKKFNVPLGIITQGKTCLEKLKTLLKIIDSTTSILIRSSKRWSLAAAISVGIDEKDEIISDEDTLSGKNTFFGNNCPKRLDEYKIRFVQPKTAAYMAMNAALKYQAKVPFFQSCWLMLVILVS